MSHNKKYYCYYFSRAAGLFSYVFSNPGVYEICDGERPHLKSVIIVKPAPKQHVVKITKEEFIPGKYYPSNIIWIKMITIKCSC